MDLVQMGRKWCNVPLPPAGHLIRTYNLPSMACCSRRDQLESATKCPRPDRSLISILIWQLARCAIQKTTTAHQRFMQLYPRNDSDAEHIYDQIRYGRRTLPDCHTSSSSILWMDVVHDHSSYLFVNGRGNAHTQINKCTFLTFAYLRYMEILADKKVLLSSSHL